MGCMPAYWTNKKSQPSVQAVSQLSLSQAPHGFGASYRGFPAFLAPSNCLKTAKLCRLVCKQLNVVLHSNMNTNGETDINSEV